MSQGATVTNNSKPWTQTQGTVLSTNNTDGEIKGKIHRIYNIQVLRKGLNNFLLASIRKRYKGVKIYSSRNQLRMSLLLSLWLLLVLFKRQRDLNSLSPPLMNNLKPSDFTIIKTSGDQAAPSPGNVTRAFNQDRYS